MSKSELEAGFLRLWRMDPTRPEPVREYAFAKPDRDFRFDFAWPSHKVAVEVQGGLWKGHGHQRGVAYTAGCEKSNLATTNGWAVFYYTTIDMKERPVQCVEEVAEFLKERMV